MTTRARFLTALLALVAAPVVVVARADTAVVTQMYGRAQVNVETRRAQPGGVFAVMIKNARWSEVNTLLDGRRASLAFESGVLFGIVPVAVDTQPADHKFSLFFPGGRARGGSMTMTLPVTAWSRPSRSRPLSPDAQALAASQMALGHARYLLAAIRTREPKALHIGPLKPPVDAPITFPFGGNEDFGMPVGPVKDGLMGEHHRGVDYDVPVGTVVKAPGNGVILLARSLAFSGETVAISHGRGLVTVLSHLDHVSVREGDPVVQGTAVGVSGKSGIGALTAHLCFSVYLHSINIDPEAMMDADMFPAQLLAQKR